MARGDSAALIILVALIAAFPLVTQSNYTLTVAIFSGINALVAELASSLLWWWV